MSRSQLADRRPVGLVLLVLMLVAALGPARRAHATPVPGASGTSTADSTGASSAQASANEALARVTGLSGEIRTLSARVVILSRTAALAQARSDSLGLATRRTAVAVRALAEHAREARINYAQARTAWVQVIAAQYEGGDMHTLVSTAGNLLVAPDPAQFLASEQMSTMVARYRSDVADNERIAATTSTAAAAKLETGLQNLRNAAARTLAARTTATDALEKATKALSGLRSDLVLAQVDQQRTDAVLSRFLGGWSVADPARADALDSGYLDLARKHHREVPAPPGAGGTTATAAQGLSVVWRTLMWIGTPYAWAGGTSSGPTPGVCSGGGAQNDCHVTGFDCSGLTLYGWAPYASLPHLAADQYRSGTLHPDVSALRPGDLAFWSTNGTVAGIHHVALYVGDGNVVQAPNSGDIVRVTPLGSVDSGYFGATRPIV